MAGGAATLNVAYLHYGSQSGVTAHVAAALEERGHRVRPLYVPGPLELRDVDGNRVVSWRAAVNLTLSAAQYGRKALAHRWNTAYAFDVHTQRAGRLLRSLPNRPHVVLQNGGLFAPGTPLPDNYTLLLDHTRALSMERPAAPDARLDAPVSYGPGWQARETMVYQRARSIATFSRRVAESLQRDYGVQGERIHVVGAGANVHPAKIERQDDGQTFLFVGKDFHRKGGHVLLRAFERVHRQRPETKLIIAGPNESLDLPEGASNRGFIPPEELAALFAQATIFVLPTLREPFGIAFLDAMACGLPCIGTAVEAVPEVIDHERTGLLVPPGNDVALANAMLSLLDDPARRHAMGLRGRQRVDSGFTWAHVGARLERALYAAAARRASANAVSEVA